MADLLLGVFFTFCFQVMTMLFTTIGSAADYGTLGRQLLLAVTVICWATQFASMSLTCK